MKVRGLLLCWALVSAAAVGETLNCNLQGYKPVEGLKAEANAQAATLTWSGESARTGKLAECLSSWGTGSPVGGR